LTAAGAGFLGTVVGGIIATTGVVYVENSERQREDEKHEEATRGSALLLVDEFRVAGLYFERSLHNDVLTPVPPDATIVISDSDRRLLAANLHPDAYGRASEAAIVTNHVLRRLRTRGRGRGSFSRLIAPEGVLMAMAVNELTEAREAVRPLTGETPAIRGPKPPLRRKQPPIPPQPLFPDDAP
jgi:hypothetical protein